MSMSQNLVSVAETEKKWSHSGYVLKGEPADLIKWIGYKMREQEKNQG